MLTIIIHKCGFRYHWTIDHWFWNIDVTQAWSIFMIVNAVHRRLMIPSVILGFFLVSLVDICVMFVAAATVPTFHPFWFIMIIALLSFLAIWFFAKRLSIVGLVVGFMLGMLLLFSFGIATSYPVPVQGSILNVQNTATSITTTSINTETNSPFDFTFGGSPNGVSITQGDTATATITIVVTSGTPEYVVFYAHYPTGFTGNFNAVGCTPNPICSETLTFTVSSQTPIGNTQIQIDAVQNSAPHLTHYASVPITVVSNQISFSTSTPTTSTSTSTTSTSNTLVNTNKPPGQLPPRWAICHPYGSCSQLLMMLFSKSVGSAGTLGISVLVPHTILIWPFGALDFGFQISPVGITYEPPPISVELQRYKIVQYRLGLEEYPQGLLQGFKFCEDCGNLLQPTAWVQVEDTHGMLTDVYDVPLYNGEELASSYCMQCGGEGYPPFALVENPAVPGGFEYIRNPFLPREIYFSYPQSILPNEQLIMLSFNILKMNETLQFELSYMNPCTTCS